MDWNNAFQGCRLLGRPFSSWFLPHCSESPNAVIYHVTQYCLSQNDTYTIHNFNTDYPRLMLLGSPPVPTSPELPELHGYQVTLSVHAGNHCLPPPGVFNWHYLQCIIKQFGTPEYKSLPDIRFFIYPFRTASDNLDDEASNEDSE